MAWILMIMISGVSWSPTTLTTAEFNSLKLCLGAGEAATKMFSEPNKREVKYVCLLKSTL